MPSVFRRFRIVRTSTSGAWIPKTGVHVCMHAGCGSRFGLTVHRHHCRVCGAVVCDACSRGRIVLHRLSPKPQRVCKGCQLTLEVTPALESHPTPGHEVTGSVTTDNDLQARGAFVAEVASSVVAALLSVASRVPGVGRCADLLRDIFALHQVCGICSWSIGQLCRLRIAVPRTPVDETQAILVLLETRQNRSCDTGAVAPSFSPVSCTYIHRMRGPTSRL